MKQELEKYRGKLQPVPEWSGDIKGGYGWFTDGKRDLFSTNPDIRTTLLKTQGKVRAEIALKGNEIIKATSLPKPGLKERFIELIRNR